MASYRNDGIDDVLRAWIVAHQGFSTTQRRRAEVLGRKIRVRQRAAANAVPDPHDDTVIPPLWLREDDLRQFRLFILHGISLRDTEFKPVREWGPGSVSTLN
jgi:hypothetical protein